MTTLAAWNVLSTSWMSYIRMSSKSGLPARSVALTIRVCIAPVAHVAVGLTVSKSSVELQTPPSLSEAKLPLRVRDEVFIVSLKRIEIVSVVPIVEPLPGVAIAVGGVMSPPPLSSSSSLHPYPARKGTNTRAQRDERAVSVFIFSSSVA